MANEINNKTVETMLTERPDYENEIIRIIRGSYSPKTAQGMLEDYHGSDVAQVMENLNSQERKKLYRICSAEMIADALEHLEEDDAGAYLNEMDLKKASAVVSMLETDSAANILREIQKEKRSLIIDSLSPEIRSDIRLIASFDEDEIGSRMTTNCVVILDTLTVPQAMNELISQAEENDNISTIFVTDETGEFSGAIDLRDLITARRNDTLDSITVTSFPYLYAQETIDDCIEQLKNYSEASIPVLDNNNRFLGVITAQNVIEVIDDEMGEDSAKLGGLTAEEDLHEPLFQSIKKRLPWLLALLGLGIIVSTVVGAFEKVVAQLTMIMAFQSLILDMAGNVGTQSLAVTIRVLMDENLSVGQKFKLVAKETRVGFSNGIILGAISILFVGLYIMLFKGKDILFAFSVSGCIGLALLIAMAVSSAVGTLIPIFFKKIKIDPAVASGPLITTINDLVAVVTYYGLSWVFLINFLQLS